jgi:hypothetical protein
VCVCVCVCVLCVMRVVSVNESKRCKENASTLVLPDVALQKNCLLPQQLPHKGCQGVISRDPS